MECFRRKGYIDNRTTQGWTLQCNTAVYVVQKCATQRTLNRKKADRPCVDRKTETRSPVLRKLSRKAGKGQSSRCTCHLRRSFFEEPASYALKNTLAKALKTPRHCRRNARAYTCLVHAAYPRDRVMKLIYPDYRPVILNRPAPQKVLAQILQPLLAYKHTTPSYTLPVRALLPNPTHTRHPAHTRICTQTLVSHVKEKRPDDTQPAICF
jgi:hypothetical protein